MERLRRTLKFLMIALFALTCLLTSKNSTASHAMGADITYTCLGGNTYRVQLSFYRDCIGISAPGSVYISVTSASCGENLGLTAMPVAGTGQEVTQFCPTALSTCNGGVYTGIQEWIYEGIITLPRQCDDWLFSYSLCCRNAAITNISNPGFSTFYLEAHLDNLNQSCNSSPVFTNKPVPFACLGQQFCFNHGAYDPDGDSLVFSLITPLQTAGSTVNYIAPFDANQPLSSTPPVSFNALTGDICMTPTALEVTVMAVLVQEYRNGILIGSVERDIQITVMDCANTLPWLSGINGSNSFTDTICADEPYCFFINSLDPDSGQTVSISWDGGIPGATFTTTSGIRPDADFCWTPGQQHIGTGPHCFTAKVTDDNCPMFGSQIFSYCLTVIGLDVDLGPDRTIACNDLATITATASGGTGNYTYLWSNGFTNPTQTLGIGTYVVTVNDGECTATDTINVVNNAIPTAEFTYSNLCFGDAVQFNDISLVPFGIITSWIWDFGDGNSSNAQNPSHTYSAPGTYNASLFIQTNLGCTDTVSHNITILPNPMAQFTAANACEGGTVSFNNTSSPAGGITFWHWSFGDGNTSNQQNPSHVYSSPGTYQVTLIAGDTSGCYDTLVQAVTIYPLPTANFSFNGAFCQNNPVTFNDLSVDANGLSSWYWTFGNGTSANTTNPVVSYDTAGTYNVTLVVSNIYGCIDSITQTVNIGIPPVINVQPAVSVCTGDTAILIANGNGTIVWEPGSIPGDSLIVVSGTGGTYTATLTDPNGCTVSADVTLTILPLPVIDAGPDQSICIGDSITLIAGGGANYYWEPLGTGGNNIVVSPSGTTTYTVTGTDTNACVASDIITVSVNPNPTLQFAPVFACSGSTAQLDAGPGVNGYIWSTGDTTQVVTVDTSGVFTVTISDVNGCTASGTITVNYGAQINIDLGSINFCFGDSAVLDAGNPGNTYLWTPGGDTTQAITVYTGGTYGVTITDTLGCSNSITTNVIVDPAPNVDFLFDAVCLNDTVYFNNISTISSGTIVQYDWSFGDGSSSQQTNPYHVFSTPGAYTVTLTAISSNGCSSSISKTVDVYPLPNANFSATAVCLGQSTSFTGLSTISVGNIVGWNWDFGDGTSSSVQNPGHIYAAAGSYDVTLIVTSGGGCVDSINRQVTVHPNPVAAFNVSDVCFGVPVSFNNSSSISSGTISTYNWNFGNGTTGNTQNPQQTYASPGNYNIVLIANSGNGCRDTAYGNLNVFALPIAEAGPNQEICAGDSVILSASPASFYLWNETGSTNATITVGPTVTTTFHLSVSDTNSCTAEDSVTVLVNPLPNANAGPDRLICLGKYATLTAGGSGNYLWSTGEVTQSISVWPVVDTDYFLTVSDANGCTSLDTVHVGIRDVPNIDVGPDIQICESATVALTATGGVTYVWYPGSQNANPIYVNPGQDTMYHVFGIDSFGCSAKDSIYISIMPEPVVNLGPTFLCAGSTTVLDAGNPGSQYQWSNGETTQTINVDTSGTFNVVVIGANGCASAGSAIVTMGGSIPANTSNRLICDGDSVTLNAGAGPYTYQWSTGETTQFITVDSAGTYSFTITDSNGCSGTFQSTVTVSPNPVASFNASNFCEGTAVSFVNNSTISSGSIITHNWTFDDGNNSNQLNPSHQYSTTGIYDVSLQVISGDGCRSTTTVPVEVLPKPVAAMSFNKSCLGTASQFSDSSYISSGTVQSLVWNFGNGQQSAQATPAIVYNAAGTYTVSLVATSDQGCTDTATASITINNLPVASFTAQDICGTMPVQYNDLSSGNIASYQWTFADGSSSSAVNPVHNYSSPGTYTTQLIVVDVEGCSDTVVQTNSVHPMPVAGYKASTECRGDSTSFSDLSFVTGDSIVNWFWTINNNVNNNGSSIKHLFSQSGNYNVQLIVVTSNGCRDTVNKPVEVYSLPQASFNFEDVCEIDPVNFSDSSLINVGSINSYAWNFGDGIQSAQASPSHHYSTPGTYNVSLVIVSDNGCKDSIAQAVNVFPQPNVNFAAPDVCFGDALQFQNQSQIPGGGSLTFAWDFGDGSSTDPGQHPSYSYTVPGTYDVTLQVTSTFGCTAELIKSVDVHNPPVAYFNPSDACVGQFKEFHDSSYAASGKIVGWHWTFGDGANSSAQNPIHTYQYPGIYGLSLTVSTDVGCTDTHIDSLTIHSRPEPLIAAGNICLGESILFSDTSNSGLGNYLWNFGDGTNSNQSTVSHVYAQAGTYSVSLYALNDAGCSRTADIVVQVYEKPAANFGAGDVCEGDAVKFSNFSSIPSGSISQYAWHFGDGSVTSAQLNPIHLFSNHGTYNVSLTAISDNGCVDSIVRQINVNPMPDPGFYFNISEGCGPLMVQFTDSSDIIFGTINSWSWNFGNGQTSDQQNPVHIYNDPGTYQVSLTITSNEGCISQASLPGAIEVYPGPEADFEAEPEVKTIIDPSFHFQNHSHGASSWYWSFGDGNNSLEYSPDHVYLTTGTFPVYLIVTNDFGCTDSILKYVKVNPEVEIFIPNAFTPNDDGHNDIFQIKGLGIERIEISIFDRWGEKIFVSNDMNYAWDGYVKGTGTMAKQDVYVYVLNIYDVFGDYHVRFGEITLLK